MKIILLENERVQLKPLTYNAILSLAPLAYESSIWEYKADKVTNERELLAHYEKLLKNQLTFLIFDKLKGKIAGTSSYGNVQEYDRRLEIGWTWIGEEFRGTGLNKNCKFLLLKYAFETLEYERVELKTDAFNVCSQRAIEKIGGTKEGLFRSHMQSRNRRRDTVYYSILKKEWKGLKETVFQGLVSCKVANKT